MANEVDSLLYNVANNGYKGAGERGFTSIRKVQKLPQIGISGVLYQVPKKNASDTNLYDEYIWTGMEFKLFMENVDGTASTNPGGTDTNTTYTLTKDPDNGRTIILTGSDGTVQSVTIDESASVDTNTTYTMNVRDGKIYLTPSEGEAQEFQLPIQDVSGFATKAELQDVATSIPTVPDTSNFVTKDELKAVQDTIPAAYNDTELREGLQKVQEQVSGNTDTNTTYTLEKDPNDPHTAILRGSDGSEQSITFEDKDTVYDDGPLKKEIEDVKASIPAAYDDKNLRDLIQGLSDRIATLESGGVTETPTINEEGAVTIPKATTEEDGTATLPDGTIDDNGIVTLK